MTALRGYGGLHFSTACDVLIYDMNDFYPEWAKRVKIACVIPVSSVLFALTGSRSAYRSEWSGHRLLTGWVLFSTGLDCFFRHTYTGYRSLSSLVNSLVDVTPTHPHPCAHTYATRITIPRYCESDVHVFPINLKVRLLNMLHSIRPDYLII